MYCYIKKKEELCLGLVWYGVREEEGEDEKRRTRKKINGIALRNTKAIK